MPMIASGLPLVVSGDLLICCSAIQPRTTPIMPGIGPKQPSNKPKIPVTIDATASAWLDCVTGRGGGGGGCHVDGIGGGFGVPHGCDIGGRSSGATHAGGSRGSHCVSISAGGVCTSGSRIIGSQLGSTGGVSSSISIVPSSEQNVIHGSSYCRLHCGQNFIWASNQFQATEEVGDFDSGVFV